MIARRLFLKVAMALSLSVTQAQGAMAQSSGADVAARPGWSVTRTPLAYDDLVNRLQEAAKAAKMGVVTIASASDGAASQGIKIPGNSVIGVYRNDFARRMLRASVAAGVEAPIRFYVTENPDGGSTLSYKTPSFVFAPYFAEGGESLRALAAELDLIFAAIAGDATKN